MENAEITIMDYRPEWQPHFERINRNWIERYFWLEPTDIEVLNQPEKNFIEPGGAILVAAWQDQIVGVVALGKVDTHTLELAKMGVDEAFKGKRIGQALAQAAIQRARELGASRIILHSNTSLTPAISLYRKLGFIEIPDDDNRFVRSNIKMELRLNN